MSEEGLAAAAAAVSIGVAASDGEFASGNRSGGRLSYLGGVIRAFLQNQRQQLPPESIKEAGAVMQAWTCHWFPTHYIESYTRVNNNCNKTILLYFTLYIM